ncbi:hypothetical protein [Butyrivibrio sp. XPD2002]|uniref:hypothetical protein n=1 Tax=Butyrivibrio sp. XPD2002 TaxID=1280665 RepID=UPI00041FCA79|nr:hypothetical protein [Butyrivibrio sp. XPD2002]
MRFIPLIILAAFELLVDNKNKLIPVYLVTGFTGLIETHVLSTLMISIFFGIFILVYFKKTFNKTTIFVLLKSALLTIFINAGFLVPFIDYYVSVPMSATSGGITTIQNQGAFFSQLISWFGYSKGGSEPYLHGPNEMPLGIVVALVAIILVITFSVLISEDKHVPKAAYPIVVLFAYLMSINGNLNRSVKAALMASAVFITVFQSTWYLNDYYLQADSARHVGVDNVDHYLYFIEYGLTDTDRELTKSIPEVVSDDAGLVINNSSRRGYDFKGSEVRPSKTLANPQKV